MQYESSNGFPTDVGMIETRKPEMAIRIGQAAQRLCVTEACFDAYGCLVDISMQGWLPQIQEPDRILGGDRRDYSCSRSDSRCGTTTLFRRPVVLLRLIFPAERRWIAAQRIQWRLRQESSSTVAVKTTTEIFQRNPVEPHGGGHTATHTHARRFNFQAAITDDGVLLVRVSAVAPLH